jgi:hypothetical protein
MASQPPRLAPLDFRRIIRLWPSVPECAAALNISVATVRSWVVRRNIPQRQWDRLIEAARRSDIIGISTETLIVAARIAQREKRRPKPTTDNRLSG